MTTLTSPLSQPGDEFGRSVAAADQIALVGAPGTATGGTVYVFHPAESTPVTTLTLPHNYEAGRFGERLATQGSRILVSDPTTTVAMATHGAVLLYQSWKDSTPYVLTNPATGEANDYGATLAWGPNDLFAIAAPLYPGEGRVFVYTAATSPPQLLLTITDPVGPTQLAHERRFGRALAFHSSGMLAIGDPRMDTVYRYDSATGALLGTFADLANVISTQGGGAVIASDGEHLFNSMTVAYPNPLGGLPMVSSEVVAYSWQTSEVVDKYFGSATCMAISAGRLVSSWVPTSHYYTGRLNYWTDPPDFESTTVTSGSTFEEQFGQALAAYGSCVMVGSPGANKVQVVEGPTPKLPPAPPTGMYLLNQPHGPVEVRLPTQSLPNAVHAIERSEDSGEFDLIAELPVASGRYVDTEIQPGKQYCYRARTSSIDGTSAYTDPVCITGGDQPLAELVTSADFLVTCNQTKRGKTRCDGSAAIYIENVGYLKARRTAGALYLSDDPILDAGDLRLKKYSVPKIHAQTGQPRHVRFRSRTPLTGKYLIVEIDAKGKVSEGNKNNNVYIFGPME